MIRFVRSERVLGGFLTLAVLNGVLVVPELALRAGGFYYQSAVQFGYPRPRSMIYLQPDERLFWRLPSSRAGINSLGFPGDEVVIPKPADTYRIVFLGDSCTYQGYPVLIGELLTERAVTRAKIDVVNLSVPGYSSHQGRIVAELFLPRLEPDLVFVYYGWNDHWLAYGAPDAQKTIEMPTGLQRTRIYQELASARLLQLGHWLGSLLRREHAGRPLDQVRVPEQDYRKNLVAIRDLVTRLSVPVVFVTAPTSHYRLGVPEPLIRLHYGVNAESVMRMHRSYNQVCREVAAAGSGVSVIDLERELSDSAELERIFLGGGIHFSEYGARLVAERIAEFMVPFLSGSPAHAAAEER